MAFSLSTVFGAIDRFSGPLRKMEAANARFASSTNKAFLGVNDRLFSIRGQLIGLASGVSAASLAFLGYNSVKDYETALASLSSITGVTGTAFNAFKTEVMDVAKRTRKSAIDVAKAFELVGSAKPELLSDAKALGVVSEAAIVLSKASKDDLAVSAQSLVGTLNQFGLGAEHSTRVINALAAGSLVGAAAIPEVTSAIDKFGAVAAASNVSVESSIALIETLAEKNIKGAEAGTALRNVLSKMSAVRALPPEALNQLKKFGVNIALVADSTVPFQTRLQEMAKIQGDAVALTKVFGLENVVAGRILLSNTKKVEDFTKGVTGTNTAYDQAAINSATFATRLEEIKNAFVNFAISGNESTNVLSRLSKKLDFVYKNFDTIMSVLKYLIISFIAWKAIVLTSTIAIGAYNIATGIMGAVTGVASVAIGKSTLALKAYKIATAIATAAQWAWNVAMTANPIGVIIVGIALIIAGIVLMIVYWDKVKAKIDEWSNSAIWQILSLIIPVMKLVELIAFMQDRWAAIKKAFTDGGFLEGLKAIGKSLLSFVLKPLEVILRTVGKIPGMGLAASGAESIAAFRAELDKGMVEEKPVNTTAAASNVQIQKIEQTNKQKVEIMLNNKTDKNATVKSNPALIPVITPSF